MAETDARIAYLALPYEYVDMAEARELIVDSDNALLYYKKESGEIVVVGDGKGYKTTITQYSYTAEEETEKLDISDITLVDTDDSYSMQVYIGGVLKTPDVNYKLESTYVILLDSDGNEINIPASTTIDIIRTANITAVDIDTDMIDGSIIINGTITDYGLSSATGQIKERVATHIADTTVHITAAERELWNSVFTSEGTTANQLLLQDEVTETNYEVIMSNAILSVVETASGAINTDLVQDVNVRTALKVGLGGLVRFLTIDSVSSNNLYKVTTLFNFDPLDGAPLLINFSTVNTGSSSISINGNTAISIASSVNPITLITAGKLDGLMYLIYDGSNEVFIPYPLYTLTNKAKLDSYDDDPSTYVNPTTIDISMVSGGTGTIYVNDTFPAGEDSYTITNENIVEESCSIDVHIDPDYTSQKQGSWTVLFEDGTVTITTDSQETVAIPITLEIRRTY